MTAGRPKKTGNQICSICKKVGFSYTNTVKVSNTSSYFYIRFRHNDRTLKDHDIDTIVKEKERLKYATEYNRMSNQVTSFTFNPYLNNFKYYPIKRFNQNQAVPIVIYDIKESSIPSQLRDEVRKIAITKKEKDWVLDSEPVKMQPQVNQFYNEILNSGIVTFGEDAVELGNRISRIQFSGNVIYRNDQHGIFTALLRRSAKNKKLSVSCTKTYNHPTSLLT